VERDCGGAGDFGWEAAAGDDHGLQNAGSGVAGNLRGGGRGVETSQGGGCETQPS
jgi:hypothetical protein